MSVIGQPNITTKSFHLMVMVVQADLAVPTAAAEVLMAMVVLADLAVQAGVMGQAGPVYEK